MKISKKSLGFIMIWVALCLLIGFWDNFTGAMVWVYMLGCSLLLSVGLDLYVTGVIEGTNKRNGR